MKEQKKGKETNENAITLIALIISIIVMLILAGVSISILAGDNGILTQATNASTATDISQTKEEIELALVGKYDSKGRYTLANLQEAVTAVTGNELDVDTGIVLSAKNNEVDVSYLIDGCTYTQTPNAPALDSGMIPVYYNSSTGNWVICSEDDENWYDYSSKKWANVMMCDGRYDTTTAVGTEVTKDELGSMFVWIPRYAYKIEQDNGSGGYKSESGVISIVFLDGTTNYYANAAGNLVEASTEPILNGDETEYEDYVVHPCFANGNGDYDNGEWDAEISGFWVSKFEAGSAMSTSDELNGSLGTYDSTTTVSLSDGNGNTTTYYYPVFKGQRYSYNCLTASYIYNMCLSLNDSGNIYSLSSSTDSHMIKNSEWRSGSIFKL